MQFGDHVRCLRQQRDLTQADLAGLLEVSMSYICKVENGKLSNGEYPSERFIKRLSKSLKANEDELLLLADKVPTQIRKRIRQRPELFRKLANCSRRELDELERLLDTVV
ncbi:Helix-turn-helix domain protein [Stieleria bergensis]|uniref:Helix-turn-helix domain protein n=1 Tax=Stieleria bergensis TaxID=2528025 RepID=A0A517SWX5_9BACT|nr:Helix-turn-helix domain protein [Planctomycetes bacterium SV_7m_r]